MYRDVNFSDHRPIAIKCICMIRQRGCHLDIDHSSSADKNITQWGWDHADLLLYRSITGVNLQSVLVDIVRIEQSRSVTSAIIGDFIVVC